MPILGSLVRSSRSSIPGTRADEVLSRSFRILVTSESSGLIEVRLRFPSFRAASLTAS